jgi:hypothetical protein
VWPPVSSRRGQDEKAELDAPVADAIADCYDEDEQASGLYNMIEDG